MFSKQTCEKRAPRSTFFRRPFCFLTFPAQLAVSSGRPGSVFHRRIQTIGKLPLTTENVLPSMRNAGVLDYQTANETKMQMYLIKTYQINTKVANEDTKQLFIVYC
jgi:hypothetical protein